ncbi:MAG: hypothetical protein HY329_19245 [Chloroflexi bacterium]|nr:hypothetical protein [Chloroflexota bacterium]
MGWQREYAKQAETLSSVVAPHTPTPTPSSTLSDAELRTWIAQQQRTLLHRVDLDVTGDGAADTVVITSGPGCGSCHFQLVHVFVRGRQPFEVDAEDAEVGALSGRPGLRLHTGWQGPRRARDFLWNGSGFVEIRPPATATPTPIPPPVLEIASVTSPAYRGTDATLRARTVPGAPCSIVVEYKSGPSEAQGLYSKSADSAGWVSWTWRVGTRTTPGYWPITVTCAGVSRSTSFAVQ